MDSIRIGGAIKRVAINGDPNRVIEFDPSDVVFVERFRKMIAEFDKRQSEFERRAKELDADKEVDENGLPVGIDEKIAFMREVCEFAHKRVDELFGEGAALRVFEGRLSLEAVGEFFEGLTPLVQSYRADRLAKYLPPEERKNKRSGKRTRRQASDVG
jgi:hypothetical protein